VGEEFRRMLPNVTIEPYVDGLMRVRDVAEYYRAKPAALAASLEVTEERDPTNAHPQWVHSDSSHVSYTPERNMAGGL
jgi:hypothetical protein